MFVAHIKSPRCQKCEETLLLRLIEPEKSGFDAQTFECPKCFVSETFIVSISGEAEVSNARSPASRTPPHRHAMTASRSRPGLDTRE
jgi:hypothetical protein